jgi:hypothetical protein
VGVVECRGSGSEREVVIGATGAHSLLHSLSPDHLAPCDYAHAPLIAGWFAGRVGARVAAARCFPRWHRIGGARREQRIARSSTRILQFRPASRRSIHFACARREQFGSAVAPTRFYGSLIKRNIFKWKKCSTVLFLVHTP